MSRMRLLSAVVLGTALFTATSASAATWIPGSGSFQIITPVAGSLLTATITDIQNNPLPGAVVTVYKDAGYTQIADNQAVSGSTADATGIADVQGSITFTVPAGTYYLYTSYDLGLAGKVNSVAQFTATSGVPLEKSVQLVFVGVNATVSVADVLNNPLAGADIVVYKDAGYTQIADNILSNVSQADATGKTDAQGKINFQLSGGTYYASVKYQVGNSGIVNSVGNWTVANGVINNRSFQLTSVGTNIEITITDINNTPVPGAEITIYTDAARTQIADDYNSNISTNDATATTDAQGKKFFNLPAGTYYAYAKYDFGLAGATTFIGNVSIADDVLNQYPIQLKTVGTNATITVTDLANNPLPGATVTVFKDGGQTQVANNIASNVSQADATGITDTQGKIGFTVQGGAYYVLASYGTAGSAIAKTQTVSFVDGVVTNMTISLATDVCPPGVTGRCTPPTTTVQPCAPTTAIPCTPPPAVDEPCRDASGAVIPCNPPTTTEQPCIPTTTHPCTPPPPTDEPCHNALGAVIPCHPPPPPTDENPCALTLNALIPCEPTDTGGETTVSRVYSLVTVDPKALLADGVSTALVSVTLRDGHNMPVVGQTVLISTPLAGTAFSASSAVTDSTGRATFSLSGTAEGVALISAVADGVALNTVWVEFSKPGQCPFVPGSLFKLTDDGRAETQADNAVYYYGSDCKRHAFPNERIFGGWYRDFGGITSVTSEAMARMGLGKNVVYRPAARMVKFTTLNKVYVVGKGGALRWVTSEDVAKGLYGNDWNKKIDDVSDAFFTNYTFGADVQSTADYNPTAEQDSAPTISLNF